MVRILLIGNGAREHALAEAIAKGAELYSFVSAKNPGIEKLSRTMKIAELDNRAALTDFISAIRPNIAVIGPESPLADGTVDYLESEGIRCFGPKKTLARLETSKGFTRDLMKKYSIPGRPKYKTFRDTEGLKEFLSELDSEGGFVIKPDGLTGGKGVMVQGDHLESVAEGFEYSLGCLEKGSVIVEEKLEGEEFSLQCITDGKTVLRTPVAQDHKRAYEDDKGPNTGGMGSYSCSDHLLPFLKEEHIEEAHEITKKVADALYKETGEYYRGVMYGGFMITSKGLRLIEYNARFGDPEAMNILPIMQTDFTEVLVKACEQKLEDIELEFRNVATVCKYVVPEGYPADPVKGECIQIKETPSSVRVYYASVDRKEEGLFMSGSRAIAFVGIDRDITVAENSAENAISHVKGAVFHRKDIGTATLLDKRVRHMRKLYEE